MYFLINLFGVLSYGCIHRCLFPLFCCGADVMTNADDEALTLTYSLNHYWLFYEILQNSGCLTFDG